MSRHIRTAEPADLPSMLRLYEHLNPTDAPPDAERAQDAWSTLLASPLATVLLAEDAGVIASSCTLIVVPNVTRGVRPYAFIENVVTHVGHRCKGLASALLAAALDIAWSRDCYKVMLATGSQNPATLRFYERAGFVRGGKTFFEARPTNT